MKNFIFKFSIYILGMFILTLGVVLFLKANLGSGSWDAFNYHLHLITNKKLTLGMASQITAFVFLLIVILYHRKKKYLFSIIPILITGFFLDFWNLLIFKDFSVNIIYYRILLFILALITLPLGLSIMKQSGLATKVIDELTAILMVETKIYSFAKVRIGFEFLGLFLAILLGLLYNGKLNEVSFGTLIISFFLGPIISMFDLVFIKIKNYFNKGDMSE